MALENVLVIGLGEVGRPLYELLAEKFPRTYGYDLNEVYTIHRIEDVEKPVDVVHIAYPFEGLESFVKLTLNYIDLLGPRLVVIHSTVAPGTTRTIQSTTSSMVVYSPVRGRHPNLKKHLMFWPKWISATRWDAVDAGRKHLEGAGFVVKVADSPESLELAKLWETVYRAAMIACWQEIHRIARRVGASIEMVAEFVSEVHEVLKDRPIFYPDKIGGHCLIPNTEMMSRIADSKLLEFILESNELRSKEIADEEVLKEIEEVKKIWLKHVPKEYYGEE